MHIILFMSNRRTVAEGLWRSVEWAGGGFFLRFNVDLKILLPLRTNPNKRTRSNQSPFEYSWTLIKRDQEMERQLDNHHVESDTKRAARRRRFWKKRSADGVRGDSRVCDRLSAGQAEGLPWGAGPCEPGNKWTAAPAPSSRTMTRLTSRLSCSTRNQPVWIDSGLVFLSRFAFDRGLWPGLWRIGSILWSRRWWWKVVLN